MSFLYPRTIAVVRPASQISEGALSYGGETASTETDVASGLKASIQAREQGQRNPVGLPGDGTRPNYYIFIPAAAAQLGTIKNLDIVIDDAGDRYQVIAPYWDSLGYRLTTELLKA